MADFNRLLITALPLLPMLVIYGIGSLLAIVRWRNHPTTSLLALFAFALFTVRMIVSIATTWLSLRRNDIGWDMQTYSMVIGIINLVGTCISVVGWIFLLIALFGRQNSAAAIDQHGGVSTNPFSKD